MLLPSRTLLILPKRYEINTSIFKRMKAINKILLILLFIGSTAFIQQDTPPDVLACVEESGPAAVYLRDFRVELPAAKPGEKTPMFRKAMVLRGNNLYRFNFCNAKGEAVIRIYDSSNMMLTSYDPSKSKYYNPVQ